MNSIFYFCVAGLKWLASSFGTTYEAINVWIFCIIWPLITLALIVNNIRLWKKNQIIK